MTAKGAFILGGAVIIAAAIMTFGGKSDIFSNPVAATLFRSPAAKTCIREIHENLRSPDSMKVESITDGFATKLDFPSFTVFVEFYAENRFGASLKALATCEGIWLPTDYDSAVALPRFRRLFIGGDDLVSSFAALRSNAGVLSFDSVVPGVREISSSTLYAAAAQTETAAK
jgi:hypothetical protein